jgi:hypothetical protein
VRTRNDDPPLMNSMKKSSSHPHLAELAHSPANSQGAFVQRPKSLARPKSNESLSAQTRVKASIHAANYVANSGSEIMFAVMNKGLAASECLVNIEEIENAPALRDEEVSSQLASSLASCIATQVLPDVGNGELVSSKAAELFDSSVKQVEARYMRETARGEAAVREAAVREAARGETALKETVERRLSRKRSRGELSVEERAILDGHEEVGKVIDEVAEKNTTELDT